MYITARLSADRAGPGVSPAPAAGASDDRCFSLHLRGG